MRERKPKPWRKYELKQLRGAIDHWWLSMSLYLRPGVTKADVFAAMPAGERQRIVASHFRGFGAMLSDRAKKSRETSAHYESKRGVEGWGDVSEVVERFRVLAAEDEEAAIKCAGLVQRVEAEGLPAELESYIPEDK